tara:strand:+ start:372 stop:617 length:246 start_codon:yes stop_codon:yes gene_type:complete
MKVMNPDNLLKTGLFFLLLFFVFGIIYQVFGGGECIEQEGINGCIVQDNLGLPLSMISLLLSSLSFFIFTIKKLFRYRQNS